MHIRFMPIYRQAGGNIVTKRTLLAILFLALLMGGGYGCMASGSGSAGANARDEALEHMRQKYGIKFTYYGPWGAGAANSAYTFLAEAEGYPGFQVATQVDKYRETNKIFSDGFLAVKYWNDTKNFILGCATSVFGNAKVISAPELSCQSASLPADASFSEYLADRTSALTATIVVGEGSFSGKEQAQELAELIAESGARYLLSLSVIKDSDFSDNWATVGEYVSHKYDSFGCNISNSSGAIKIDWNEGN
jgi:hypothetical protein